MVLHAAPAAAVATTQSSDATALVAAIAGTGFNVTGATLTSNTQNGFFSGGNAALGIDEGIVLTTGELRCVGSANSTGNCGNANGNMSSLSVDFTLDGDALFFNFVFGSEEYNSYVGGNVNDFFTLTLTGPGAAGINLAQLPNGGGVVSINNVNLDSNSAFYRNNSNELTGSSNPGGGSGTSAPSLGLPIELDGLTTVLTASADGLTNGGAYNLTFTIRDVGDSSFDSAVFIQGGTVGSVPTPPGGVPEPATWAMMIGGIGLAGGALRRRAHRLVAA